MSQELLNFMNAYGLPAWGIVLIGGGTIVAAIITSLQAIIVALINAWASQRVATYAAHRERRAKLADQLRGATSISIPIAGEVLRCFNRDADGSNGTREQALELAERLQSILRSFFFYIPTPIEPASQFWTIQVRRLIGALLVFPEPSGSTPDFVRSAAVAFVRRETDAMLVALEALEEDIDGYVFGLRYLTRRARWRRRRLRLTRWVEVTRKNWRRRQDGALTP